MIIYVNYFKLQKKLKKKLKNTTIIIPYAYNYYFPDDDLIFLIRILNN